MNTLNGEKLITLEEASEDFGGVTLPRTTLLRYIYQGVKGLKLETVLINKRYTSKEAIQRFIERRQQTDQLVGKPIVSKLSPKQVEDGLRKHKIIK